ncbi:hypothetical protein BGW80DRAFT_715422 [Lactifluus volemus]|nr:hypothetical protein BGW80DRAFT_715422 [Lactifluus volemus]
MIAALIIIAPSIQYEPITHICWLSKSSPSLIAVWLAPTGFGLTVLVLTAYNALSIPRSTESPLSRILHRDGMAFFVASLLLRCTNVVFMTLTSPGMVGLPIFCVWAIDLIGINRFLIHVRSSESDSQYDEHVKLSCPLSAGRQQTMPMMVRNIMTPLLNRLASG